MIESIFEIIQQKEDFGEVHAFCVQFLEALLSLPDFDRCHLKQDFHNIYKTVLDRGLT